MYNSTIKQLCNYTGKIQTRKLEKITLCNAFFKSSKSSEVYSRQQCIPNLNSSVARGMFPHPRSDSRSVVLIRIWMLKINEGGYGKILALEM